MKRENVVAEFSSARYFIVEYLLNLKGLVGNSYKEADIMNFEVDFNSFMPKTIYEPHIKTAIENILNYVIHNKQFEQFTKSNILEDMLKENI